MMAVYVTRHRQMNGRTASRSPLNVERLSELAATPLPLHLWTCPTLVDTVDVGAVLLFKLLRAEVVQEGGEPLTIVPDLDVIKEGQVAQSFGFKGADDAFGLEGSIEALLSGVVEAVADRTHADQGVQGSQAELVRGAGVLRALRGVMQQAGWVSGSDRLFKPAQLPS